MKQQLHKCKAAQCTRAVLVEASYCCDACDVADELAINRSQTECGLILHTAACTSRHLRRGDFTDA